MAIIVVLEELHSGYCFHCLFGLLFLVLVIGGWHEATNTRSGAQSCFCANAIDIDHRGADCDLPVSSLVH